MQPGTSLIRRWLRRVAEFAVSLRFARFFLEQRSAGEEPSLTWLSGTRRFSEERGQARSAHSLKYFRISDPPDSVRVFVLLWNGDDMRWCGKKAINLTFLVRRRLQ